MIEISKCVCGGTPENETKVVFLNRTYPITLGRLHCPACGGGPSWEQSYSTFEGWEIIIRAWNIWASRKQIPDKELLKEAKELFGAQEKERRG